MISKALLPTYISNKMTPKEYIPLLNENCPVDNNSSVFVCFSWSARPDKRYNKEVVMIVNAEQGHKGGSAA